MLNQDTTTSVYEAILFGWMCIFTVALGVIEFLALQGYVPFVGGGLLGDTMMYGLIELFLYPLIVLSTLGCIFLLLMLVKLRKKRAGKSLIAWGYISFTFTFLPTCFLFFISVRSAISL